MMMKHVDNMWYSNTINTSRHNHNQDDKIISIWTLMTALDDLVVRNTLHFYVTRPTRCSASLSKHNVTLSDNTELFRWLNQIKLYVSHPFIHWRSDSVISIIVVVSRCLVILSPLFITVWERCRCDPVRKWTVNIQLDCDQATFFRLGCSQFNGIACPWPFEPFFPPFSVALARLAFATTLARWWKIWKILSPFHW